MPVTTRKRARTDKLSESYNKKSKEWHDYQNSATHGADEKDFMDWKKKNDFWLKPGGDEKGRKTGIVYVVRPKPGQENFIKVGSTNEIWDRFKNRYREYLPAGFEMYAVAQYAGMTVKEEGRLKAKWGRSLARGNASAEEIEDKIDQQATSAAKSKALAAEEAIQHNLRTTIGEGAYWDKARNKWQPVRNSGTLGEWFDVKGTRYRGTENKTFDNPNKQNMANAPDKIVAKGSNYIPFVLDMVKQQGRHDNQKHSMNGGQMRYFNGLDIQKKTSLQKSYQKAMEMYKGDEREAWEAFNQADFDNAAGWAKRLRKNKTKYRAS